MDAYAADADMYAYERSQLPMVKYARWALISLAVVEGLTALLVCAGAFGLPMLGDPLDEETMAIVAGGICTFFGTMAFGVLPAAAAAIGLGRGAKWGWVLGIVAGVLNLFPCCACLPLGAFVLYAMLNEETRQAFADA